MPQSRPSPPNGDHVNYTVKELVSSLHEKIDRLDTRVASLERWKYALPTPFIIAIVTLTVTMVRT